MDAKNRANFINSVASGTEIPCSNCGTRNKKDSTFCITCGVELGDYQVNKDNTPAFEQVKDSVESIENKPLDIFAQGLPKWSVEPPNLMIRRR